MAQGARAQVSSDTASTTVGHFRWLICGLLFYATTVNYMDRMVLGILKPTIAEQLHWTETQYGFINSAFQLGYALMMPIAGRIIDRIGLRLGYTLAVFFWSISSMCHALATNAFEFGLARLGLGLGEASNFPAALKTVAEWFPQRERALATGLFNSGTNVGAMIAPLTVPLISAHFGWHSAFLFTGALSMTWALLWLLLYQPPERHPLLDDREREYIRKDATPAEEERVPYLVVLRRRATWGFLICKFITDPVWWFYLYWLPSFLQLKYKVDLLHIGPPLVAIYLAADIGSIGGGWISGVLLRRGYSVTRARKTAMLICALCVTPVMFVPSAAHNLWATVALIAIAAAAHQGWSANLFTVPSDCFPKSAIASVVGLGGLGGAIGGMLAQPAIGRWLDLSHEAYAPLFVAAGLAYLFALAVLNFVLPKFERATT